MKIVRMEKIGFKPDKSYFLPEKKSMYDFAHNLLTRYSLDELKSELYSKKNNVNKHLAFVPEENNKNTNNC